MCLVNNEKDSIIKVLRRQQDSSIRAIRHLEDTLVASRIEFESLSRYVQERRQEVNLLLDEIERSSIRDVEGVSVKKVGGDLYVGLDESLLFASGSEKISESGKNLINEFSASLQKYENIQIVVEGHTDNVPVRLGRFSSNWELSSARAIAITEQIAGNGVDETRLTASGKGEFHPVASNETEIGRAQNRRVEIRLISDRGQLDKMLSDFEIKEVEGVKIIAIPENSDRYLVPIDQWREIKDKKKSELISILRKSDWKVGNSNHSFSVLEDRYRAVIVSNGDFDSADFLIFWGKKEYVRHLEIK